MEFLLLINTIILLLCFLALLKYGHNNDSTQNRILTIIQDLQDITNLDVPKETAASLVDIGKKFENENALDNISRSNSLWEEDNLEGEEIEEVYGR